MILKHIEVYRQKRNSDIKLMDEQGTIANCGIGDILLVVDNEVWVQDMNKTREEQFAKADLNPRMIKINHEIFEQLA